MSIVDVDRIASWHDGERESTGLHWTFLVPIAFWGPRTITPHYHPARDSPDNNPAHQVAEPRSFLVQCSLYPCKRCNKHPLVVVHLPPSHLSHTHSTPSQLPTHVLSPYPTLPTPYNDRLHERPPNARPPKDRRLQVPVSPGGRGQSHPRVGAQSQHRVVH